ncbi:MULTISPECIES: DUF5682 family protein [unclassified Clostridium]|uniref:DUF5682 family protein n=1 Tax=unclassified Clostridium TaxID=2614128 RepID=UPI0002984FB7|nr:MULTISPECIES: DUF5682 family protein [unclassified Clostridium]EKQ56091.1 MAG: hypothetical protein A370_02313 [Clostridium sp. Maddingley MBC34-26]
MKLKSGLNKGGASMVENMDKQDIDNKIKYYVKKSYNLDNRVMFFPVRHHSPACSFHLKKVIDSYKPEIILIEGPAEANKVIKYIAHEETKAPVCIYYSYFDRNGFIEENKEKYRCYYPFLDFSPELLALREGKKRDIVCEFIDLSYAEILINSKKLEVMGKAQEKNTYNDDYLMKESIFIKALCEKEGCRNYNELWEKLFEIDGLRISTEKFIENMIFSCYLSRAGYNEEMLKEDGCLSREIFMSMKIREAAKKYNKVLVVSGGFHTSALIDGLEADNEITLHNIAEADTGVYAMAYSFEESDQLNGYASGMPHPAFYQRVFENIEKHMDKPYEEAVLNFIVHTGKLIRKNHGNLSTADEIEAFNMARGLKALRDKYECGVYELKDGITSSFVKGEMDAEAQVSLKYLRELLTGNKIGKLCALAEVPPIVQDFNELCGKFNIKTTTLENEVSLSIYKSKKHREQSKFFHIMKFLNTNFCLMEKGPDFINRKNTNLIREVWKYKWTTKLQSTLIELSVQGGSLKEAANSVLSKRFKACENASGEASLLLIEAALMGAESSFQGLLPSFGEILNGDEDFVSVTNSCYNLNFLCNAEDLLNINMEEKLQEFFTTAYNKAVSQITSLNTVDYDNENEVISKLKDIYHISNKANFDSESLIDSLRLLISKKDLNSAVEGAALGILYGLNATDSKEVADKTVQYLYGTGEKLMKSGSFLKGLFSTAKDLLLIEEDLLKGIDSFLRNIEEEHFMALLPDLRFSFTFFNPFEIDSIAKEAAKVYSTKEEDILYEKVLKEEDIKLAVSLDKYAVELLEKWQVYQGRDKV